MSATDFPDVLLRFARLGVDQFENAAALHGTKRNDARSHLQSNDHFDEAVGQLQVSLPTSKGRIFSGHRKIINCYYIIHAKSVFFARTSMSIAPHVVTYGRVRRRRRKEAADLT